MNKSIPDLGSQDPNLRNSPVADEGDEEAEALRELVPGEPACLFNGESYSHGTIVKSGTEMLRCDHGIWIPAGPSDPDNP